MFMKPIFLMLGVLAIAATACGVSVSKEPWSESSEAKEVDGAVDGEKLFRSMGCNSCHTPAGQPGPVLDGLFGQEVSLEGGETVVADEAYLRQSILAPRAKIVDGYEPIMPDYREQLNAEQIDALVAYLRRLGE